MLTAAQLKAREGKLTASRVACLMHGDADKIMQLYREMIGEGEPEDLDHIWPVRLGSATEELNLDWFEMKNGTLSRRGDVIVHKKYAWAAATLDGWYDDLGCPVECKHVGGREPLEIIIDRYQPQMQWQMEVTGASQCALSVIMGAAEPVVEFIDRDADYAAEMVKRGWQFICCVKDRRMPVVLEPIAAPVDATKIIDMAGNNAWAAAAADWLNARGPADLCKSAEKILKAAVPDDAKKCHGHGIQITRDRAGRLSLREAAL
jgi:predicted phage-related endonuclease